MNTAEAMQLLLTDRRKLIESLMLIDNKQRELVPFTLNPIQADIHETSTPRDIYVKPSQVGASSYLICDFLADCLTVPGTTAVIISYDEFISGRLLRKAQVFYDRILSRIPSIPRMHHKSTFEKTFPSVNSSFFIGSARSFTSVRGETIHDLLLDEFAFWQSGDAARVFAAAIQRVPLLRTTKIRIVSTPNGEDEDFCETYRAAKEGKAVGRSVFKHHFYPWYAHPEYSMLRTNPFALPGDDSPIIYKLIPDELNLLIRFEAMGVSEEEAHNKIRWRRYKIAEMESLRRTGETRRLFGQEYPEDDVSCFLASGDVVYDAQLISDMASRCFPASIHLLYADIWYPPEPKLNYLVAIDPGLGISSESVATVWMFTDTEFKHCATLSGLYPGPEMAAKCIELARYYNDAVIASEAALDIISHLKSWHNLYRFTDPVTNRITENIGWATNPKTKPYMIAELARHLPKIQTHDIRLVSQLRNIRWVQGSRGDRAVAVGSDDYHDSAAIAIVCRQSLPVERGLVGVSGWPDTWGR